MGRRLMDPSARKSELVAVKVKPWEKALLDGVAMRYGEGVSDLLRTMAVGMAHLQFLQDFETSLRAATSSSGRSQSPASGREGKTVERNRQAALKAWVEASPERWRSPQGNLVPSEKRERLAMLKEHAPQAFHDEIETKWPALGLDGFVDATGQLDREKLAVDVFGYVKPEVKHG